MRLFGPCLRPWVTLREALAILPPEERGVPVRSTGPRSGAHKAGRDCHPPALVDGCSPTICAAAPDARAELAVLDQWDRPADPAVHGSGHYGYVRLSEQAAAILQGFPREWVFAGSSKRARWRQIGMAMPPPLAEAVGRSVARALEGGGKGERRQAPAGPGRPPDADS